MIPDPYVAAHLHDGPHDGETVQMPWARVRIDMLRWDGSEMVASVYRLAAPWRGQVDAHYRFDAPPADPAPAPVPGGGGGPGGADERLHPQPPRGSRRLGATRRDDQRPTRPPRALRTLRRDPAQPGRPTHPRRPRATSRRHERLLRRPRPPRPARGRARRPPTPLHAGSGERPHGPDVAGGGLHRRALGGEA